MAPRIPKADPRARKRACRVMRNLTISPRSEALLEALSARTGVSRGRIVDIALENVMACEACNGRGTQDSHLGPDTEACEACAGERIVEGSGA